MYGRRGVAFTRFAGRSSCVRGPGVHAIGFENSRNQLSKGITQWLGVKLMKPFIPSLSIAWLALFPVLAPRNSAPNGSSRPVSEPHDHQLRHGGPADCRHGAGTRISVTTQYSIAHVQDNNGQFASDLGLSQQIVGLPGSPVDSDNLVWESTATMPLGASMFFRVGAG